MPLNFAEAPVTPKKKKFDSGEEQLIDDSDPAEESKEVPESDLLAMDIAPALLTNPFYTDDALSSDSGDDAEFRSESEWIQHKKEEGHM